MDVPLTDQRMESSEGECLDSRSPLRYVWNDGVSDTNSLTCFSFASPCLCGSAFKKVRFVYIPDLATNHPGFVSASWLH